MAKRYFKKDWQVEFEGIPLSEENLEEIDRICHNFKHFFLDGYPCGRKMRLKLAEKGIILKKNKKCPEICVVYSIIKVGERIKIDAHVSSTVKGSKKYTDSEIRKLLKKYIDKVSRKIKKKL